MKFSPTFRIKILLTWSLVGCTSAIIAAPRGKSFWSGYTDQEQQARESSKVKYKINKGGYLSANVLPQLAISSLGAAMEGTDAASESAAAVLDNGPRPSLRKFLDSLEKQRHPMDGEENAGQDETVSDANPGNTIEKQTAQPSEEMVLGTTGPGEPVTIPPATNPAMAVEATRPANPLFPRPSGYGLYEEKIFMYFPLEGISNGDLNFITEGSFESIFLPPSSDDLRSSATFSLEP